MRQGADHVSAPTAGAEGTGGRDLSPAPLR